MTRQIDVSSVSRSLEGFYSLIQSRTGLILNPHQQSHVAVALNDLATASDTRPSGDLFIQLSEHPLTHPLWQQIIDVITVGETYFFRNQAQFDALRSHILPALIHQRREMGLKHLRFWCAGCATGEEPYSLAILLRELLPDIEMWSITLLATDINAEYLERARKGLYRRHSFRSETPDEIRERWFSTEHDSYRLNSIIRNMVIFGLLNLVSDQYPAFENNTIAMDMIICRNVTIYFDREATRLIATRFHKALNQNGWLVVGHSEPQSDVYQSFTARNFKDTVLYQKVASEAAQPNMPIQIQEEPKPASVPKGSSRSQLSSVSTTLLERAPHTEDFWSLAKRAADLEIWDEARAWLDKAERQNPFHAGVHYLRALVELASLNFDQSMQLLRRAIYCDPDFALAHYTLGDMYHRQGAHREAARHWQFALSAIEKSAPHEILPYSDDLTVEMFVELLATRLSTL